MIPQQQYTCEASVTGADSEAQAGAAGPILDYRTLKNDGSQGPDGRIPIVGTITEYDGVHGEVSWAVVNLESDYSNKATRGKSANRSVNENRSCRRAASKARKLIMAMQLNYMMTLTYRENMQDDEQAQKDFKKFIRKVRDLLGDFPYLAVSELQARGAYHWHIAVRGRQPVIALRQLWRSVVGEGSLRVDPPKKGGGGEQGFWNLPRLAGYLTKYIKKQMGHRGLNAKRYQASRCEMPSKKFVLYANDLNEGVNMVVDELRELIGSIGYIWWGEDETGRHGWACTW